MLYRQYRGFTVAWDKFDARNYAVNDLRILSAEGSRQRTIYGRQPPL